MVPTIAITTWRRELPTFLGDRTLLYTLADEYVRCVMEPGAVAVLIPHLAPEQVDAVLDTVDGLVIAGGGDLHPSTYGEAVAGSYDTDVGADRSEIALARRARERGVPTLAICRGMQVVNVAFGGTLHQDMVAAGTPHPPMDGGADAVLAARHAIEIEAASGLSEALGSGPRSVNTIHHQAIDRLAPGFRVTARSGDGVIEAIESDDGWPFLAVQWHPEKLGDHDAALFAWLAASAAAHRGSRTASLP